MSSPSQSLTDRQRFWLDHLRRCRASGKSIAAYAAANDLSAFGLYEAQRRLRRVDPKESRSLSTSLSSPSPSPSPSRFVRVAMSTPVALPCRAHLRNGVMVELGVDAAGLGAVLRDLAALP